MKIKSRFTTRSFVITAFVFALINLLPCCMNMKRGMKTDMTDQGVGIVLIKHDNFSPGSITIPLNTTVTWTNKDMWAHTVTSDTGLFDSEKIKSGDTFTYKFTATGTYHYHCKIHDSMKATVIVQ